MPGWQLLRYRGRGRTASSSRDPDGHQLTGPMQPGQQVAVPLVGVHPVTRRLEGSDAAIYSHLMPMPLNNLPVSSATG